MGAVLVHIDLDGDRPHPASLAALGAGRDIASSWGATLYAALVIHDPMMNVAPDTTAKVAAATGPIAGLDSIQSLLARGGADKIIVAVSDAPVAPLWAAVGGAWQGVLDHLRPRLVLFGADAPSGAELGPRTGARIGARLLMRARATGGDQVELRDRDGGYVRSSDGGAAVAMIGSGRARFEGDEDIDLVVLSFPGGADPRIEIDGTSPSAELAHTLGPIVAIGDDAASDADAAAATKRLAKQLGAQIVGGPNAVRAGVVAPSAVIERHTPLAPDLCVAVGAIAVDVSGATNLVRIGPSSGKNVEGVLTGAPSASLAELTRALDDEAKR